MTGCHYCKSQMGINEQYYLIKQSSKERGKRSKTVGACCEACYDAGKSLVMEDVQ